MILYGHLQECMVLMMIVSGVLCGRSLQECTPGGIRYGVFSGISIPFDIRVRDLVVRFLVQLYLLFQISLRLTTLWTSPLEGASFTWFRDSGTDCMSRLDRTLASVD